MTYALSLMLAAVAGALLAFWLCRRQSRQERESLDARHARDELSLKEQVAAARELRDHLIDGLDDALLVIDPDSRIRLANRAACNFCRASTLEDRTLREALSDPRLLELIGRCLRDREPVSERIRPVQAPGTWQVDIAAMTCGAQTMIRVILRDVSAIERTEQVRRDFVANASHELRTPMAIIHGYLENLLDEGMLDDHETSRRFVEVMRKHSERMNRIIEDMLLISRLESADDNPIRREPFTLGECVQEVLDRLEPLITQRDSTVSLNLPDPPVTLHGERFCWTQIFFNLIENALKQNPRPGLRVEIGAQRTGGQVEIWVSDDGIGIPSADLPHIFRRFYRVDKQHSQQRIEGTGLGLSIVKRAVEAHHGTIEARSTPGVETRFTIRVAEILPQAPVAADPGQQSRPD